MRYGERGSYSSVLSNVRVRSEKRSFSVLFQKKWLSLQRTSRRRRVSRRYPADCCDVSHVVIQQIVATCLTSLSSRLLRRETRRLLLQSGVITISYIEADDSGRVVSLQQKTDKP